MMSVTIERNLVAPGMDEIVAFNGIFFEKCYRLAICEISHIGTKIPMASTSTMMPTIT